MNILLFILTVILMGSTHYALGHYVIYRSYRKDVEKKKYSGLLFDYRKKRAAYPSLIGKPYLSVHIDIVLAKGVLCLSI